LAACLAACALGACGGELEFFAGKNAKMAVGTDDIHCLAGVGVSADGPGVYEVSSSAPSVISVKPGPSSGCLTAKALTEGTATLSARTSDGTAAVVVQTIVADHVGLGLSSARGLFETPVLFPTAPSYQAGSTLKTNVVWLAGDELLRGSTSEGFTLTDTTVAQLLPSVGEIEGIDFLAPGTTQIFWQGIPGPVLNVVP
jgi:hypothetical protein